MRLQMRPRQTPGIGMRGGTEETGGREDEGSIFGLHSGMGSVG